MLNSEAITKVQSIILVAVIAVSAVGGSAAYLLWSDQTTSETIKFGFIGDLDKMGKYALQAAILAAEQINAEGGVLGRNITIIAEDDDSLQIPADTIVASNALTKLITVDRADFIFGPAPGSLVSIYQEIVAEHKKIFIHYGDDDDKFSQKVLDDYKAYKYYFRCCINQTSVNMLNVRSFEVMGELTGLNKVALFETDEGGGQDSFSKRIATLEGLGFEVVHTCLIPFNTVDMSSYFAQAEAKGAEIIRPVIYGPSMIPFIKEWYDRQSPTIIWGFIYNAMTSETWEASDGKCNYITAFGDPISAKIPVTNYSLKFREDYLERWGEEIPATSISFAYDTVRFILPLAIERAGTIETDAVIEALEEIIIEETSRFKNMKFSSSHDLLLKESEIDFWGPMRLQWQDGNVIPVFPTWVMEEAGASYIFPDWSGPWDDLD